MSSAGEMSDDEFGEGLKEELESKHLKEKLQKSYRLGDNLDFYLINVVVLTVVFEYIRQDSDDQLDDADCMAELRRLCEPSVRHYFDCGCPVCR